MLSVDGFTRGALRTARPTPQKVLMASENQSIHRDLIDRRFGGGTPPEPVGEDACATIASTKVFHAVYSASPWSALEAIPGQTAVGALWQARLGEQYEEFKDVFLQPASEFARSYPCPADCGCWHEVVEHGADDFVAVCRCNPCRCDPLPLTANEVRLWELKWGRLAHELCGALGLEPKRVELDLYNTRQIGSWSAAAVPAVLTIQHATARFQHAVQGLVARLRQPFILLAPTSQHLEAVSQELLAGVKADFFGLDAHVRLGVGGRLQAVRTPGELFAQFTPEPREPLEEQSARQAFALVRALDATQPVRKASLYTVFRLYCVEGLTVEQVARKCRCARSLVFVRLGALRRKLGTEPGRLRQYSGHFERIEESLTDSRARRVYRQGVADGDGEPDESEG